jgi:hypothetical protein
MRLWPAEISVRRRVAQHVGYEIVLQFELR